MISYKPFQKLLIDRGIKKGDLSKQAGISGATMARLNSNKYVSLEVIDKLCAELGCQPGELLEYVEDKNGQWLIGEELADPTVVEALRKLKAEVEKDLYSGRTKRLDSCVAERKLEEWNARSIWSVRRRRTWTNPGGTVLIGRPALSGEEEKEALEARKRVPQI